MVVVTGEDLGVCPLLHTCTTATAQFLAGGGGTPTTSFSETNRVVYYFVATEP